MLDTEKPILLSTGLSSWSDIDNIVARIEASRGTFALFQCTTSYPTSLENVGLNIVSQLRQRYNVPVGLSDHSGTIWPSLAALASGVELLEVHVTYDRRMYGPDSTSSLNFSELAMVCEANRAFTTLKSHPVEKDQLSSELEQVKSLFTKSLSPICNLPTGTVLTSELLALKKPGTGLPLELLPSILGKRLKHDVPSNRLLRLHDFE